MAVKHNRFLYIFDQINTSVSTNVYQGDCPNDTLHTGSGHTQ